MIAETVDMVVLSIGLQTAPEVVELADRLGIEVRPSYSQQVAKSRGDYFSLKNEWLPNRCYLGG